MKNVAVLTEDGAFAFFFRPHSGGFDSSRVPTPWNFSSKARKKRLMPGGQPGRGWAQVELTDAQQTILHGKKESRLIFTLKKVLNNKTN